MRTPLFPSLGLLPFVKEWRVRPLPSSFRPKPSNLVGFFPFDTLCCVSLLFPAASHDLDRLFSFALLGCLSQFAEFSRASLMIGALFSWREAGPLLFFLGEVLFLTPHFSPLRGSVFGSRTSEKGRDDPFLSKGHGLFLRRRRFLLLNGKSLSAPLFCAFRSHVLFAWKTNPLASRFWETFPSYPARPPILSLPPPPLIFFFPRSLLVGVARQIFLPSP